MPTDPSQQRSLAIVREWEDTYQRGNYYQLIRECRALAEDGAAHREQDDNAEDDHREDHPGA
jgi:hypothetical protein